MRHREWVYKRQHSSVERGLNWEVRLWGLVLALLFTVDHRQVMTTSES